MLSHISLLAYYKVNFALIQHHKYSTSEIESWLPFERDIYVDMLNAYIEQKNNENKR